MTSECTKPSKETAASPAARISFASGSLVKYQGEAFRIQEVMSFEEVLGKSMTTGRPKVLRVGDLQQVADAELPSAVDLQAIEEEDWAEARAKYDAIKPLLDKGNPTKDDVIKRAQEIGKSTSTLYRWLSRYRNFDAVSGLINGKRGWRDGNPRLSAGLEKIIRETLEAFYLKPERPSIAKTYQQIKIACEKKRLAAPSPTAVRARIARIPEFERLKKRGKLERAKNKFLPSPGTFPGGDYPLDVIQIDHTPIDLIIVDDEHRRPIDRAWLTVAIDIYSRMVVGYYLSLDAPSVTSVAMCVAHAMLPKDEWLMEHGLDSAKWPVWGPPRKIHVDNGADFRAKDFSRSCQEHGIDLEWRPVKNPKYGGHIERLQGTLLRGLHDLPGTTFSSIAHRDGYDSERTASLTLDELELQLLKMIVDEYHRKPHSALGMPPLRKWEQGIFGGGDTPARGLPPRPADKMALMLSFLPSFERTIQADGVTLDGLRYYDECLRPWIGAIDPETKKTRSFLFRRDPRDLSHIYFWDPELKQHFKVHHADLRTTQFSLWEHRAAKSLAKSQGYDPSDEATVLRSVSERRELTDDSTKKTKKARREAQRQRTHAKGVTPANPASKTPASKATAAKKAAAPIVLRKAAAAATPSLDEYQALGLLAELPPRDNNA
jgi:putative transposase